MLIKFIKTGNKAKSAQQYLFQERDHNGKVREGIELLRGNPNEVTELADSLKFKNNYTSAVIAFANNDNPTEQQIKEILDEFEKFAFAGLESNQYAYYAVKHIDNGVPHLHIIVPNVELQTKKALNIAPPGWEKKYSVFQDFINKKYNYADPKALERKRLIKLGNPHLKGLPNTKAKQQINEYMENLVKEGLLINHQKVLKTLEEIGEITRVGKDYISVKPQGFKKAIKLKGTIYEREFSIERFNREIEAEKATRDRGDSRDREAELKRVYAELENIYISRARYNKERYKPKERTYKKVNTKSNNRELERDTKRERSPKERTSRLREHNYQFKPLEENNHNTDNSPSYILSSNLYSILGNSNILQKRDNISTDSFREARSDAGSRGSTRQRNIIKTGVESRVGTTKKRTNGNTTRKEKGLNNDRIRERIIADSKGTKANIQRRVKEYSRAILEPTSSSNERIQRERKRANKHNKRAKRNIEKLRKYSRKWRDIFTTTIKNSLEAFGRAKHSIIKFLEEKERRKREKERQQRQTKRSRRMKI